jgi:hypothetical protein
LEFSQLFIVALSPPSSSPKQKSKKSKAEKPKAVFFNEFLQSKKDKFNIQMSHHQTIQSLKLSNLQEKAEMLRKFKFEERRIKKQIQRENTQMAIQLKEEEEFEKLDQQL